MGNSQSYSHSSNSNNKTSSDNNGDNNVWEEHRELKQVTLKTISFVFHYVFPMIKIQDANNQIKVDFDPDNIWKMHRNMKKPKS